jgi:hypothetical protein
LSRLKNVSPRGAPGYGAGTRSSPVPLIT